MYEIRHFVDTRQKDIYQDWYDRVRDTAAKLAIDRRLNMLSQEHFGDHKFCRDSVWELRIDVGPGYRIYYAMAGKRLILLMCAGDKRSQSADIAKAVRYWQQWQAREKR